MPAPDLIGRDFTASTPGMKLVGDITYIPTDKGWLYLATWLDLATREIVGYSMADHHRAGLVVDALKMAAGRGQLKPGCIAHSDRGSEYTFDELRCEIGRLGLRQSMGRTGACFDNAAAESFVALLKEEIGTRRWPDRASAAQTSSLPSRPSTTDSAYAAIHAGATSPVGDPTAPRTRTRPRGVSIECPRSRGSFNCHNDSARGELQPHEAHHEHSQGQQ
ncbi:DDE-type integrase/transposase/recombinase [Streptomyces sp. NPDC001276]|uniref:DDE-type integrase/transposase/recombinase n=1 Tax=Streptomyces sp. NPDC001276 TaxID=3364555 RepID=UPI0036A1ECAC